METSPIEPVYTALGRGDWTAARELCRELLASEPGLAALHHAIGLSFCGESAYSDAVPHLERALDCDRATSRWRRDLGVVYARLQRWSDSLATLTPALQHLDAEGLIVYLTAARESHAAASALVQLEQHRSDPLPGTPEFLLAYGRALLMAQRFAEAESALRQCLAARPDLPIAHDALARVCDNTGRCDQALWHWRESARLALALCDRGLADESRDCRRRAEELGLSRAEERSTRLYLMLFDRRESAASVLRASCEAFGPSAGERAAAPPRRRQRSPRRLRVGYLSGEFRLSPAYYFFRPFLTSHDRRSVEVFLYNSSPAPDQVTQDFVPWGEHWKDVAALDDAALAALIRRDELDAIVDLSGHFPYNRLHALSHRVAAAHFTFPNYPSTTGAPGMDWFLTDRWTSPAGSEAGYSERLYRLPSGYLAFDPPADGPEVGPLPRSTRPYPTFGLFQRLLKFNDGVWDTLGLLMSRVPDARLVIQNGDSELGRPGSETCQMLRRNLDRLEIDPARVTIYGPLPRLEHMAIVTQVDVTLDTFPYTGQTTTCESLWMGVPVVTLRGDMHVSRVSGAIISRCGHPEWVADSPSSYVEKAAALAADVEALSGVRARLRSEFIAQGLTDGRRLAGELEAAYASAQ